MLIALAALHAVAGGVAAAVLGSSDAVIVGAADAVAAVVLLGAAALAVRLGASARGAGVGRQADLGVTTVALAVAGVATALRMIATGAVWSGLELPLEDDRHRSGVERPRAAPRARRRRGAPSPSLPGRLRRRSRAGRRCRGGCARARFGHDGGAAGLAAARRGRGRCLRRRARLAPPCRAADRAPRRRRGGRPPARRP